LLTTKLKQQAHYFNPKIQLALDLCFVSNCSVCVLSFINLKQKEPLLLCWS